MINSHGELMINHDDKPIIKHKIVLTVVPFIFGCQFIQKRREKYKKSKNDAAVRAITLHLHLIAQIC